MPLDLCKIGQILKDAREGKGLTLDEVSRALFIKKQVISAIESGDWGSLPHPVYVKGYINQYAALLQVADLLQAEAAPPEAQPSLEKQRVVTRTEKKRAPKAWTLKKKLLAASAMAVVVVGFLIFQNLPKTAPSAPQGPTKERSEQPVQASSTIQVPEATADQPVAPNPAPEQVEKPVLEPKTLTIACQERTWVRIVIDGTEQKEFTLNPEEVVKLKAEESFDLVVGNAGGVTLFYNGKDTGFTGEAGEVKRIHLP